MDSPRTTSRSTSISRQSSRTTTSLQQHWDGYAIWKDIAQPWVVIRHAHTCSQILSAELGPPPTHFPEKGRGPPESRTGVGRPGSHPCSEVPSRLSGILNYSRASPGAHGPPPRPRRYANSAALALCPELRAWPGFDATDAGTVVLRVERARAKEGGV